MRYRSHRTVPAVVFALVLLAAEARADKVVSLDQAFRMANRNHPTMEVLRERVEQAKAARYKAWSAVKPTANAQTTFTIYDRRIELPPFAAGIPPIVLQEKYQWGFTGIAKLPLFVGPAYPAIQMAYKQVELSRLSVLRSQKDFLLQVANAYYAVVTQKEIITSLERKVALDRKHLAAARAKLEVGQTARGDVLRAELVATQDEQQLTTAKINLAAARRQLAILLGQPGSVDVRRPTEPTSPAGDAATLTDRALRLRTDVRASALGIEIAEKGKEAAWWGFLPSLDLSWIYRWSETTGFTGDPDTWYFVFTLNIPIYDGGVRYASLRDGASKLRRSRAQHRALKASIRSEVVKLRADVASAESSVVSARKSVELARTSASDMQASYEVGAVSQLDALDASQRQLEAEINLSGSLYRRDMARLALAHALGQFNPSGTRSDR